MALTEEEFNVLAKKICNSPEQKAIANQWADEFLAFREKEAQKESEQKEQ